MVNFIWPTTTKKVTSGFRPPHRPSHHGIDIAENGYHEIYASAAGTVSRSENNQNGYGQCIFIVHNINGQTWETVYAHMRDNSRTVSVGQTVRQNQQIGVMGNTGDSSGQHLHFELHKGRWNGSKSNAVNPLNYLDVKEEPNPITVPNETPSDNNYYRIHTGLFTTLSGYERALNELKAVYNYTIYLAPDEPKLVGDDEWRIRFYTGRVQGQNNARILKKAFEDRFSWNIHIVDANQDHEEIDYKAAGNSENTYYRIMTGFFRSLGGFNNARATLKQSYSGITYEASDDSRLREDGDLKLRFYTGRVMGITAAQELKARLEQQFSWNFNIIEAQVGKK
ncbi:Peptidase family M23 [Amphibacillus marinus]|uniref:Peptidase family M23 n=1 Tax=Amphibacillus marinus TaxID=872970 RepID=A0A1H8IXA0_9BACI|nr:M23 family metallopeptidase [Amphibacillus marinus]SEN73122.1 Peptidase family M23 [Amphibacillus marinus]